MAVTGPLRALAPPPDPDSPPPDRPAIGQPGVLEDLARAAGLHPREAGEVDVPYKVPDQATLERGFLVDAGFLDGNEDAGREAARTTIVAAAAPFRRDDGSYRFENRFRYLVARPSSATVDVSRTARGRSCIAWPTWQPPLPPARS